MIDERQQGSFHCLVLADIATDFAPSRSTISVGVAVPSVVTLTPRFAEDAMEVPRSGREHIVRDESGQEGRLADAGMVG